MFRPYVRICQWPVTDIGGWALVNASLRNKKNLLKSEPKTRVEKYKVGAAVQILETTRFILVRDDLFTTGQPSISVTGHWRILSIMLAGKNALASVALESCKSEIKQRFLVLFLMDHFLQVSLKARGIFRLPSPPNKHVRLITIGFPYS